VEWLYQKRNCSLFDHVKLVQSGEPILHEHFANQLHELYYFSEKYQIELLMDQTMDAIKEYYRTIVKKPDLDTMLRVYEETTRECELRWFVARYIFWAVMCEKEWQLEEVFRKALKHEEFIQDMFLLLIESRSQNFMDATSSWDCIFEEHDANAL
jgi:hypothetical protein